MFGLRTFPAIAYSTYYIHRTFVALGFDSKKHKRPPYYVGCSKKSCNLEKERSKRFHSSTLLLECFLVYSFYVLNPSKKDGPVVGVCWYMICLALKPTRPDISEDRLFFFRVRRSWFRSQPGRVIRTKLGKQFANSKHLLRRALNYMFTPQEHCSLHHFTVPLGGEEEPLGRSFLFRASVDPSNSTARFRLKFFDSLRFVAPSY